MTGARLMRGIAAFGFALWIGPASAAPSSPELVIDVASGQVLHADEATRPWYPASTTKLMTAYVALRAIKTGELKLETPLIASAKAASQPPSKVGIRPGQEITLDNALKILMVKSANDLAVVIAEGVGGSQEGFAQRMNAEAARLGMRESHFVNPHGLFNAAQVSSARDLAVLGRALLNEFPDYRDYWGIGAVQLGQKVMKNTNGLIGRYPGAEGMKTGFICPSGFNVVALASRGGRTLLAVVLGAGSGAERSIRTAQMLDRGFAGTAWGPSLGQVTTLAASGYGSAPNMRQDICGRGRQIAFEDDDGGKAISLPITAGNDNASVFGAMMPSPMPGASSSVGGKAANGRAVLGPRADLPPILVYLGRAPGSTEMARGPGKTQTLPKAATAFAPPPPARPSEKKERENAATGAPLQLPGVITEPAPRTTGLRTTARNAEPKAAPGAIRARTTAEPPKATPAKAGAIAATAKVKAPPQLPAKKKKQAAADDDE